MTRAEHFEASPELRRRGKSRASLELIAEAWRWLAEVQPTTVRAVCYHLFIVDLLDSMAKKNTDRVSVQLRDAREVGTVPWEWVVDETREVERAPSWDNAEEYLRAVRRSYRKNYWAEQPLRVEVWSEKGTVRGTLAPVLNEYGVGFQVTHGHSSATQVHAAAEDSTRDDRPLIVLYVGDWDVSGMHMSEVDLPERIARYGGTAQLYRVALTEADHGLPSYPASDKGPTERGRGDTRYPWYVAHYGARCWELDAMDPNALRERVRDHIEALIEPKAWARSERVGKAELDSLENFLGRWPHHKPRGAA